METNQYNSKRHLRSALQKRNKKRKKFQIGILILLISITMIACVLILAPILAQINWSWSKTIIFEPSCYQSSSCDEMLLDETTHSLTQRADAMGYNATHFTVKNNGLLVGRIPEEMDDQIFFDSMTNDFCLEFVDFGETYVEPDTMVQTSYNKDLVDNEKIFLTVLSNDHISTAKMTIDGSSEEFQIQLNFNAEGTKLIADYSATHIGQFLGIVLDNKVISCPIINSALTGGSAVIQGDFTYETASELAGFLSSKPLPYELTLHE